MDNSQWIKESLWNQMGASLDMLENAIIMCPDEQWDNALNFWYSSFHCIFWTDYYLSFKPEHFAPPTPFTFSEFDPSGKKPERTYTKAELLSYIHHCRQKAKQLITGLTLEALSDRWINNRKNYSLLEIIIYNIRHIQHHAAQLNLLLRQTIDNTPGWVSQGQ
ncbi:MAG TPA: DinB family protein [Saprospiraceae bacterium]|nr:DinB family protein [Saprospiraceae bacterium]